MNKEDIEHIKKLLFEDRLTQYGKRELIKYLEQKEADNYEANNIINLYIEKRQKLMEILEKEITIDNMLINANKLESIMYADIINIIKEKAVGVLNIYRKEILKFVKGEENIWKL